MAAGGDLPHDLYTFVIEDAPDIERGFWGCAMGDVSKGWNPPGLQCAQILSNDAALSTWDHEASFAERGASPLGVVANAVAYAEGRPWLDDVLAYLDGNRAVLADGVAAELPSARCTLPEGIYLAWFDCRELGLGDDFGHRFLDAGVGLIDGRRCGASGRVRINLATPRPILVEMLERMGRHS